jgi:hypothetical protein
MKQNRGLFRLSIQRAGRLIRGDQSVPCEVLDLTEKGMLIRAADSPAVTGDQLGLEFALTSTLTIHCTIAVTHAAPPHLGARIADISREDQLHLSRFIDQLLALNMTGF